MSITGADIPPELFGEILRHIPHIPKKYGPGGYRAAASTCSLVCKYWNINSRDALFEEVVLTSRERAQQFYHILRAPPIQGIRPIPRMINMLVIRLYPNSLEGNTWLYFVQSLVDRIPKKKKPLLLTLNLTDGVDARKFPPMDLHRLLHGPVVGAFLHTFTWLTLESVHIPSVSQLCRLVHAMPFLTQMSLTGLVWSEDNSQPPETRLVDKSSRAQLVPMEFAVMGCTDDIYLASRIAMTLKMSGRSDHAQSVYAAMSAWIKLIRERKNGAYANDRIHIVNEFLVPGPKDDKDGPRLIIELYRVEQPGVCVWPGEYIAQFQICGDGLHALGGDGSESAVYFCAYSGDWFDNLPGSVHDGWKLLMQEEVPIIALKTVTFFYEDDDYAAKNFKDIHSGLATASWARNTVINYTTSFSLVNRWHVISSGKGPKIYRDVPGWPKSSMPKLRGFCKFEPVSLFNYINYEGWQ